MGQMIQQTIKRPLSPMRVIRISLALFLFLIFTILLSMLLGTADVTIVQLWGILTGDTEVNEMAKLIVLNIRLPRIMSAGLAGFSLSLGGLVFQAILRNPLADPYILGVSSGGAFGAVLGIMLGFSFNLGIPLLSFAGAMLSRAGHGAKENGHGILNYPACGRNYQCILHGHHHVFYFHCG
jgi:iron complex transport system permease protein